MKRIRRARTHWRLGLTILLAGLGAASGATSAWSANPTERQDQSVPPASQIIDNDTRIDANNLDMWVTNQGSFSYDIPNQASGLIYPKGTQLTAVYASGLWIAGKVNGEVRGAIAEYSNEFAAGRITSPTTFEEEGLEKNRVYKISLGDTDASNPDYAEWPVADGAPVDSLGNPLLLGDQTLWSVYHDLDPEKHTNRAMGTTALGVEIQQTTFGFNRPGPLGNVYFMKWKVINKGSNTIEDAFVSMWSDPDLGGAGDDLVGADTTLSLGYVYNATNRDNLYGSSPPAVGFDFFQGPIVESPGDTASVSGVLVPGYRNLPMTSFNKYINGTDPDEPGKTYGYMQGFDASGATVINPATNKPTRYSVSGDPVARTGWLDTGPADRRLMLSSGPFTMAPGDTQEVVGAVIVGRGADRFTSITALKFNDFFAQTAFDENFDLPRPPIAPVVDAAGLDGAVVLSWDGRSERDYVEGDYHFEGYNVYQGASIAGPWTRIATYDVNNDVGIIFDDQFDARTGVVVSTPVQFGSDSGIRYTFMIEEDLVFGGPIRVAKPYYYTVTSYSYNGAAGAGLKTLENAPAAITVVPEKPAAGETHGDGAPGIVVRMERISGTSDGFVDAIVVDPSATTGDVYEVRFDVIEEATGDSAHPFIEVPVWNLINTTRGVTVLADQRNQTFDDAYLIADGIQWRVAGALPGFKTNSVPAPMIDEIAGPGGVAVDADGKGGPGNDVWHSRGSTAEWLLSAGGGDGGVGRLTRDGSDNANLTSSDIFMKWDGSPDNIGVWAFDKGEVGPVPFGFYERNPVTGVETRLLVFLTGGGGTSGVYDYSEGVTDPFSSSPATDWAYAYRFDGDYEAFLADVADGSYDNDTSTVELFARLIVVSRVDPLVMPAQGTVIQFSTTKPNSSADVFRLDTSGVTFAQSNLEDDLEQIRVVPNPYRAHSVYELNQFDRRVKFTGLPREAKVRIFNLAGELVRTLDKPASSSSILEWDLTTDRALPVASGVYIYHVEARDGGRSLASTHGRLAIFIEKERLNTF